MIETTPLDVSEYLDSPEMIAAYLAEAFATGDAAFISDAFELVARAKRLADEWTD